MQLQLQTSDMFHSTCAWKAVSSDQKVSKEKMACSWPGSERFLGPGFRLVSGRCSCLSSA
jgi:hypothetical protein